MFKIAFHLLGTDLWPAGRIYLHGLLQALQVGYAGDLTICLLSSKGGDEVPEDLSRLADEIFVYPTFRKWSMDWVRDRAAQRLLQHDVIDNRMLKRLGVKVIALGEAPRGSNIPTLAWLPDFQHIHLPTMFSAEERQVRDVRFLNCIEKATRVLLLSESVKRDFEAFVPRYLPKVHVISPVTSVPASVYENDPSWVSDVYHIPYKFIYIPNQFWKHKNHRAAFSAAKMLKDKGIEIFIVCSGYPGDYRHPHYTADLFRELSLWGIRSQVAVLGLVPREHVFALIRQSICVLNPSLFEGYGMTVDEARSIGKQVLLSDIPVHREQTPPQAVFFDPQDCEDLARKLEQIWRERPPGPDAELEREARHSLAGRILGYATSFMSVVREVVGP